MNPSKPHDTTLDQLITELVETRFQNKIRAMVNEAGSESVFKMVQGLVHKLAEEQLLKREAEIRAHVAHLVDDALAHTAIEFRTFQK